MNKFIKVIIFSLLICVSTACSYDPIFSMKDNYEFKIERITLNGDKEINSIIKRNLSLAKTDNESYKKKYYINVNTTKEKKIISKDSEGDPSTFEISITAIYEILDNQKLLLNRKFENKNIYNNESDKFKLKQSEKIIIENLSEKISDDIISSIINLNDN